MWTCVECGETSEDSADVCWNCGTSREGVRDPTFRTADDPCLRADEGAEPLFDGNAGRRDCEAPFNTVEKPLAATSTRKQRIAIVAVLAVLAGWLIFWSTSYHYTVRRSLSPRITLVERHTVERTPFFGMGHNDQSFWLPIPYSHDSLEKQVLERDGEPVWETAAYGVGHAIHVSPDENLVAIEDAMRSGPMLIMDLSTGRKVQVDDPIPDGYGHHYDYPFHFVRWADDSSSILAEVTGSHAEERRLMAYRELWRIDPKTGKSSQIERQTKPWKPDIQWE